jgi:class 3 adenylate cyclase/alpha-beta hydrolase superfamily lysophospholipase
LAYQVIGEGDVDLLWLDGLRGGLEVMWEHPLFSGFFTKLSAGCRVIRFDMRGTGLSDRGGPPPDLETQMSDACAVLDVVGSQRTAIVGHQWGTEAAALFAATFPRRTKALVLISASARNRWAPDYPWGFTDEVLAASLRLIESSWGTEAYAAREVSYSAASMLDDHEYIRWVAKVQRHWLGPGGAASLEQQFFDSDVRQVLRSVQAPTLVVARHWEAPEEDDYVASLLPNAKVVRLPGADWMIWVGDQDSAIAAMEDALAAKHPAPVQDRELATVLFTDIVGSTAKAAELGDRSWAQLIEDHDAIVRQLLKSHRGVEVNTAGDGFFATFDGPARAVRCAHSIAQAVRSLGIEVRVGVHTGECETISGRVSGIAVMIGARVGAAAGPSEVLVSQTVKDLVAGSGLTFENAGEHELKGVPNTWRLYRALP